MKLLQNAWEALDKEEREALKSQVVPRLYSLGTNPDQAMFERAAKNYLVSRIQYEHQ